MFDPNANYKLSLIDSIKNHTIDLDVSYIVLKEVDDLFQNESGKTIKIKDIKNKLHSVELETITHLGYSKLSTEGVELPSPSAKVREVLKAFEAVTEEAILAESKKETVEETQLDLLNLDTTN